MDPVIRLLADLVAANSVNPSLVPGAPGEAAAADVVAQALRRAGLDVIVEEAAPGRPNVVGVLDGRERGPAVMLCGHLDTVGVDGMRAPFTPEIRDGRLYGRGAQDMKSGVAAMVGAAAALAASWTRGRLIVAGVIDVLTNFIEHPEVVADRLERMSGFLRGPEQVMAGTDCGFDTSAGMGRVAPDVVWAKLRALTEGARLASSRLYSGKADHRP